MIKVLIIYANSDPVLRQSVAAMLYSFKDHLKACDVYYHNAIFNRAPILGMFRHVDIVVFHHSVTTVWDRGRYNSKIDAWLSCDFGSAKKVALMQDEYKNVDLLRKFISELSIEKVFTLAPPKEWRSIYGEEIVKKDILKQYLSGYVETAYTPNELDCVRDIDIGYRADWTKMHVKLGLIGLLKRDISSEVKNSIASRNLVTDIEVGSEYFISGSDWNIFLRRCRYVIGVPSGSSVLDKSGNIERQLLKKLTDNPRVDEDHLYNEIVCLFEGSLALEVLSPRHLEAISNGCGQILIESDYNGILKPWVHYLPLKRDFSNIEDILFLVKDENLRLQMIENCQKDILSNPQFSYESFTRMVVPTIANKGAIGLNKSPYQRLNNILEAAKSFAIKLRYWLLKLRR